MSRETFTKALVGVIALTLVVSALAMSGAASFSAQEEQDTETQTQQTSSLRVAHFSPDAPAVNVTLGNETVASGAEFGNVTDYVSVPAGTHNVTITAEGQPSDVLFEGNVTMEPRMVATVSASGEFTTDSDTEFQPVVFEDDAWEPEDDMAAVSVVHLAPDAGSVDVVVAEGPEGDNETGTDAVDEETESEATETPADGEETDAESEETGTPAEGEETDTGAVGEETDAMAVTGTVLASNVTFQNASDYMSVPAGNYTLEIRSNETNETLATVELSVEGGNAYSAVAAGYANPDESLADDETEAPGEENETEAPGEETETEAPGEETETPEEETPTEEEPGEETPTATEAGA
ncbi:hypothetical protein BRD06_07335 [Halobacteriales archaeon QS_9_67_15]|nr:MAG: hypothetical protein BRD06_07335 [Halobacteriales archaeon QS_9_67_15]